MEESISKSNSCSSGQEIFTMPDLISTVMLLYVTFWKAGVMEIQRLGYIMRLDVIHASTKYI